jgi:hypothetical protein
MFKNFLIIFVAIVLLLDYSAADGLSCYVDGGGIEKCMYGSLSCFKFSTTYFGIEITKKGCSLAILPCVSGTIKVPSILFLFVMIFLFL